MIVLPAVRQVRSPNFSPTPISHDLFVLHDQEGHTLPSVAWLCDPRSQASAHMCLGEDGATVYQLVPLSMKAWAQCAFNGRAISLEMPGFADKGFSDDLLRVSARIAAWCCQAYGIPVRWAEGGQGRGLCCHHDLGIAGGGHVDVGPVGGAVWLRFMQFVRQESAGLRDGLPPPFALNGAPGPYEVAPLAYALPAPSHQGAARNEPGDTIRHPTPSGYPAHSIAALQADLNAVIGAGLEVDGGFGPLSVAALERFQATHGLVVDGVPGPMTWAIIEGALTRAKAA